MPSSKPDVASSLSTLTIDAGNATSKGRKPKPKKVVADSWEDENMSSNSDSGDSADGHNVDKKSLPSAPPPTPISPTYKSSRPWSPIPDDSQEQVLSEDPNSPRRPEKTDAVARRMIAGALGIKAPKQTEEQKAYEKAMREQEKKRRDEERATERKKLEDTEKAKAAIWDD